MPRNPLWRENNKIILLSLALLHFLISWVSFMRSEMIHPNSGSPFWLFLTKILSFPCLYLPMGSGSIDLFPFLMACNSFLWSFALVAGYRSVAHQLVNRKPV